MCFSGLQLAIRFSMEFVVVAFIGDIHCSILYNLNTKRKGFKNIVSVSFHQEIILGFDME